MTRPSLREYAAVQRERSLAAARGEKGKLLDEVVAVTGLHRKAAIRLLRRAPRAPTARSRAGRPWLRRLRSCGRPPGTSGHIGSIRSWPFWPRASSLPMRSPRKALTKLDPAGS